MNNAQELDNLAQAVREEGMNQGGSMKDLVFDPVTGEFRPIPRGTHRGEGDVVTEMTDKGFAAEESHEILVIREDDLENALKSYHEGWTPKLLAEEVEKGIYHIRPEICDETVRIHPVFGCYVSDDPQFQVGLLEYSVTSIVINPSDSTPRAEMAVFEGGRQVSWWHEIGLVVIPSEENLFSRSKGLLEVGILKNKRVLIVGLGSFGSQIAIELAKAGVGAFSLVDFDRVELHNLSRHTATVRDLGRLKTNVIAEAVLGKNPYARLNKFPVNVNEDLPLLYDEVEKADLVICATDNNTSRFNISKALVEKGKVGIFGRAVTRAEGGDVFRYRPGGPCYCCLVGTGNLQQEEISDVASARRDGRIAAYVSPEDAEAMVQVGLSSDIAPICNLMVKLALVELSRGAESGISSLEDELVFDYYLWANRREKHFANWKAMPNAGGMPTILRWYGARIQKEEGCPICSEQVVLDDGDGKEEGLDGIEIDLG